MIRKHRRPGSAHHESFDSLVASVTANCYLCRTIWQAYAKQGYDLTMEKDKFSNLFINTSLRRGITHEEATADHDFVIKITGTTDMFPRPENRSYGVLMKLFLGDVRIVGKCPSP